MTLRRAGIYLQVVVNSLGGDDSAVPTAPSDIFCILSGRTVLVRAVSLPRTGTSEARAEKTRILQLLGKTIPSNGVFKCKKQSNTPSGNSQTLE